MKTDMVKCDKCKNLEFNYKSFKFQNIWLCNKCFMTETNNNSMIDANIRYK